MAIIRKRDILPVSWTGEPFVGPEDRTWILTLGNLRAMTKPEDWDEVLPLDAEWQQGVNGLTSEAGDLLTATLNTLKPWDDPAYDPPQPPAA